MTGRGWDWRVYYKYVYINMRYNNNRVGVAIIFGRHCVTRRPCHHQLDVTVSGSSATNMRVAKHRVHKSIGVNECMNPLKLLALLINWIHVSKANLNITECIMCIYVLFA